MSIKKMYQLRDKLSDMSAEVPLSPVTQQEKVTFEFCPFTELAILRSGSKEIALNEVEMQALNKILNKLLG